MSINEELLNTKLNKDNINIIIEYLKDNVKDHDLSNIKCIKDNEGNFILSFEDKEIKLPSESTVGETLYTINDVLNITSPVIPESLFIDNAKTPGGNQYVKPLKSIQTASHFNIAIDMELYDEIMSVLDFYEIREGDLVKKEDEEGTLSGELLNFYEQNYEDYYGTKYNELLEATNKLYENVQMSVMYYLSIDDTLAKNLDTIIDSIFAKEYDFTQMMYDTVNTNELSYEEYVSLINDNQEFFDQQRIQFLSEFMFKFEVYADQFKSVEMPKMLDSVIEMAYYTRYSKDSEFDFNGLAYQNNEILSSDGISLKDGLLVFKEKLAKTYFEKKGIDVSSLDSFDHSLIPEEYWNLNSDSNNDLWVKTYGEKYNSNDIIIKHDLYNKFLLHASYYEESFTSIGNILFDENNYLNEESKYPSFYNSQKEMFEDALRNIDYIRNDFNSLYNEHTKMTKEFINNSNQWNTEEINKFCDSYISLLNKGYGTSKPDGYNNIKDIYNRSFSTIGTNYDFYCEAILPPKAFNIGSDVETDSIVRTLCKYRGITDETLINEMLKNKDQYERMEAIPNLMSVIYKEVGYDGLCSFIADYYNYINDYCDKDDDYDKPFDHVVSSEEVKVLLMQRPYTAYYCSIASSGNLFDFSGNIANEFKNQMAYIKNTQETADLYFTKKLDTSMVTDEMRDKAKAMFNSNDLKYLEDWQIDAYALLLNKDNSENSPANKLYHEGSPRGALNSIIVQGRAFDSAKSQVEVMTAAEYLWATITGFSIGTYEGVGNFISGIKDVIWADGEVSEAEYRQQFVRELLTTDYSLFQKYRDGDIETLNLLSSNYDYNKYRTAALKLMTSDDFVQMMEYAKTNNIPSYELEYMLDLINEDEYTKYKSLYQMKDNLEDINYYAGLYDKRWLTGYTNVVYSVGQGVGNMLIPLTLNIASAYFAPLSYLAVGLTSLSTVGRTREGLMQQGVTNDTILWTNSLLHGLIEGAGEAIFGTILKTPLGKNINKCLSKIPGIGKVLNMTDDIIGQIDNLPFESELLKSFLKSDLQEICEELGENFWGYVADGFTGMGWPSISQIANEAWETTWQTALTTPILNAFSGVSNKMLKKKVTLDNGVTVTLCLNDILSCINQNGSIDSKALYNLLSTRGDISGSTTFKSIPQRLNVFFNKNVIKEVGFRSDGTRYVIINGFDEPDEIIDYIDDKNLYSEVFFRVPDCFGKLVNSDEYSKIKCNTIIENISDDALSCIIQFIDVDKAHELCFLLNDDNFKKVFNEFIKNSNTRYKNLLNEDVLNLYKERILHNVNLNDEINNIFDSLNSLELNNQSQETIKFFRNVNWNNICISENTLKVMRRLCDKALNNNNIADDIISGLFYKLYHEMNININAVDTSSSYYQNNINELLKMVPLCFNGKDVLDEYLLVFSKKDNSIAHKLFINELYGRKYDSDLDNKIIELLFKSNGEIDYFEVTKLVVSSSPEAYRKFNKFYTQGLLLDYLKNNNNISQNDRNILMNLIEKNPNFDIVEIERFFENGKIDYNNKFDYIGFLEYGLINNCFDEDKRDLFDIDYLRDIKQDGTANISWEFNLLKEEIENNLKTFNTEEEKINYLKSPDSAYTKLSLLAYTFAMDVNLRKDTNLNKDFKEIAHYLSDRKYEIIKAGNKKEVTINGIKLTIYGSDDYINYTINELSSRFNDIPAVYLDLLSQVGLSVYDYSCPDNLRSLFDYYESNAKRSTFISAGNFDVKSFELNIFFKNFGDTLYHELGHELDNIFKSYNGNTANYFYSENGWQSIIDMDNKTNNNKIISDYATTNNQEDFAEFSWCFGISFEKYCKQHPNRSFMENLQDFDGMYPVWGLTIGKDFPNRFKKFKELLIHYYNNKDSYRRK